MKKVLTYLVLVMAIGMAGIVAYVSVNGLLKVFAGAGTLGLLFFVSIEIAKVVATSAVHTFGKKIGWIYSSLLSLGILISMIITSVGIYGFLSTSYKESYNSMLATENKIELVESKKKLLIESKENINKDIQLKRERISKILEVRTQQEVRLDSLYKKNWYNSARKTEKVIADANNDIKTIEGGVDELSKKLGTINDSINKHSLNVIELKQNNEGASELNSLKYLSTVTGKSMDEVMKWFILLLIVIGDPMAVLMVIVFNKIMDKREKKTEGPNDDPQPVEPEPSIDDEVLITEEFVDDRVDALTVIKDGDVEIIEQEPEVVVEEVSEMQNYTEEINEVIDEIVEVLNEPEVIEPEPVVEEDEFKTEIVEESKVSNKVTRDEIKEVKERGFSVEIPERPENDSINRIGSNKEIRGGDTNRIYFKRTGGNKNANR